MFQFSIRSLLVLTTVTAVAVWVLFVPPQTAGLVALMLVYMLLPAIVVAGIIYHHGSWRAFFIGLSPWALAAWLWLSYAAAEMVFDGDWWDFLVVRESEAIELKLGMMPPLVAMIVSGLAAVAVRYWALRVSPRQGAPARAADEPPP